MPLDHYVPQVHLNKFACEVDGRLWALNKVNLKAFRPRSQDVCRIAGGSTNPYLRDERVLEDWLKTIEPKYSKAVLSLQDKKIDQGVVYTIAGFISYLISCSPAAVRIRTAYAQTLIKNTAYAMDAQGLFPPPPESMGAESITELFATGAIRVEVDKKYPHAEGINTLLGCIKMYGNCTWEILRHTFVDSPFFTSDYPVAIEKSGDPRVLNRLIPLCPTLAVRCLPDINLQPESCDMSFSNFRFRFRDLSRQQVMYLNRAIVRCAETTVFYPKELPWIYNFVNKNRHYRIEPRMHELPHENGVALIFGQTIASPRVS